MTGFYKGDGECLLRGTKSVKCNKLIVVHKGLILCLGIV